MVVKRRAGILLAGTMLGASVLFSASAFADDTQQLQQQINQMQKQLQAMQDQLAQTKQQARAAQQTAQQAVQNLPPGVYAQAPSSMLTKAKPSWLDSVHISMAGSFIALEGAYRQHNEVADGASSPAFGIPGIPLMNSALWSEREFRMSAQQSRLAFRAYGDMSPQQHLQAYYEMDFLGASTDANNRESNSFTPRIRQLWATYDNDDYHFHFLGGQAWSMMTQNRVGITPLYENVPLTIDAQYVVGFNWLRNPQLRFVADWNQMAWFGLSIEQPQAVFPGAPSAATVTPPGQTVSINNTCTGGSHLNNTTTCSNDISPDIIEKFALDPGWGHYEAFALERWFSDQVTTGIAGAAVPAGWSQQTTFGWGVGGSFLVPAIPQYLDLQGSVMYGQGIGRYSSSQLPDAVIGPTGSLTPLTQLSFMVGAVAHPMASLDVYAYYGEDRQNANWWTVGATQGGWGNPNFVNNGCLNQGYAAGTGAYNTPFGASVCTFDVQMTQEFTAGFWQTAYKGELGRVVWGLQYEYVRLTAFPGPITATFTPNQGLNPNNNILMFSFRYYPFN